jgi:Zn-dependent protease
VIDDQRGNRRGTFRPPSLDGVMFRVIGFEVQVRRGFVVFLVLIVALYGDAFGVWLAGSLAAFTLVHELGHAVAARRHGARAAISLDFLAGYTSFVPTRPLSLGERATISVAGPATHIALSVAVLLAMGVNPLDRAGVNDSAASAAIWWAGPVIGMFNLIPVLPLDGGHIAQTGLERAVGARAHRLMVWFSLGATGAFAAWLLLDPNRRFFVIFVAFLVIAQVQMLGSGSERPRTADRQRSAAADAERAAWTTGRPGMLVPGQELSPWYRAHRSRLAGRPDEARRILVDDLSAPATGAWWPPDRAGADDLRELVALLPRPLPTGNPFSEHVLADVLLRTGDREDAGRYAAATYGRTRSVTSALMVARAAASMGDRDSAVQWLAAAVASPTMSGPALADAVDRAPELARLRNDPDVIRLMSDLDRR